MAKIVSQIEVEKKFKEKLRKLDKEEQKFIKKFPEINLNDEKYEIKKEYDDNSKLKIIGQFLKENKIYNGKVIEYFENGNIKYQGDYKNNKRDGKGILYYEIGNKYYDGDFKLNKFDGKGISFYKNGIKQYEGDLKLGKWDGKGKNIMKMELNYMKENIKII